MRSSVRLFHARLTSAPPNLAGLYSTTVIEMSSDEETYSLFRENIIDLLTDEDFFVKAIAHNYNRIGTKVGCRAQMSGSRLRQAYDYWIEDVQRTMVDGLKGTTTSLDHYKHAAFITFWLRRTIPINNITAPSGSWIVDPNLDKVARRTRFVEYGNELCALLVGHQICIAYEAGKRFADDKTVHELSTRMDFLRTLQFPEELLNDFVLILKHKSLSPYGLLLMYKALWADMRPRDPKRALS